MYKNPIFGDNIPQKTIKSHPDIIFFQNSLKYSKYASISPTIFSQKNSHTTPHTLPVAKQLEAMRKSLGAMGRWGKSHGAVGSAEELLLAHGGAEGGDVGGVFVEAFGVGETLKAEAVHPHAEYHEWYET